MNSYSKILIALISLGMVSLTPMGNSNAKGGPSNFPKDTTVTTLSLFQWQTEGLTADNNGNFYTAARGAMEVVGDSLSPIDCPVYRVSFQDPNPVVVGYIPKPNPTTACSTAGLAFNQSGELFVAAGQGTTLGWVYHLTPNATNPPTATIFATDVPVANGIAFDKEGNLWVSDGASEQGRIWKIPPSGGSGSAPGAVQFRVQPMRNSVALVGSNLYPNGKIPADGVGRQIRSFPPGLTAVSRGDFIVANGIAFNNNGDLLIADTARGAIWKAEFDNHGNLTSPTGCDSTFASNTLCLSNILVAHPMLESIDGIVLDAAGNIWGVSNARQAVVFVTKDGSVQEIFRNPVNGSTGLRNAGDQSVGNNHILEFPASPFMMDHRFCTVSFDGSAPSGRDNSPPEAGEIDPTISPKSLAGPRGKISCIDQDVMVPGLPLPI